MTQQIKLIQDGLTQTRLQHAFIPSVFNPNYHLLSLTLHVSRTGLFNRDSQQLQNEPDISSSIFSLTRDNLRLTALVTEISLGKRHYCSIQLVLVLCWYLTLN